MKKLTLTLTIFSVCVLTTQAQDVEFVIEYGSHTPSQCDQIRQTTDGNLILLTTIRRANSLGQLIRDIQIIKTNPDGDTLWTNYVGLDERSEMGRDFEILDNGNMLITGYSSYDMGTRTKGFLFCVDSTGNLLWDKYYGNDSAIWVFTSLKVNGDAVVLAGTEETSLGSDALIVKTSLEGDSLWSSIIGGDDYDDAWDIDLHPDGGYIFTGGTYSYASGSQDDAWIVKINADGAYQWRKTYGVADRIDWAWAITPSHNISGEIDGYVFTGLKESAPDDSPASLFGKVHLVKVDTEGEVVWDKSLELPFEVMRREGTDIVPTNDGGYAICGYGMYRNTVTDMFTWGIYFLKIDGNGEIMYELLDESNSDNMLARSVIQWDDDTYYISGTKGSDRADEYMAFLAKIATGTTTGINNDTFLQQSVSIFPNPSDGYVTLTNNGMTEISEVNIFTIDGRSMETVSVKGQRNILISLAAYRNQTLFIQIKDDKGNIAYKKVVVL